jgi:hypothetical protein
MYHAKALRIIGQSLESARVATFEVEKQEYDYLVKCNDLTTAGEWILRSATSENFLADPLNRQPLSTSGFRFTPLDISRLDAQWQKQRRNRSSSETQISNRLSQFLRTLGDHLERAGANVFHISWKTDSVSVEYFQPDGHPESRTFTISKLHELGLHNRFRRSSRPSSNMPPPPHRRLTH